MERLGLKNEKRICKHIAETFDSPMIQVDEYIFQEAGSITRLPEINISTDELIDLIGNSNNAYYDKFIKALNAEIEKNGLQSKIRLTYDAPFYYLDKSEYGKSMNSTVRRKLESIIHGIRMTPDSKLKGDLYESFCCLFLRDLGFEASVTKSSGDIGIDIVGSYTIQLSSVYATDMFTNKICVLAQAKCYENSVDSSVVRALHGDSILIRHDSDLYPDFMQNPCWLLVFSDRGFTSEATRYARKHNIYLMDSRNMVDLLCTLNNETLSAIDCFNIDDIQANV